MIVPMEFRSGAFILRSFLPTRNTTMGTEKMAVNLRRFLRQAAGAGGAASNRDRRRERTRHRRTGAPGFAAADLLTLLFERRYELGHAEPVAALRTLMEERGLRQRNLIPVFGSSSVASGVLNGKLEIGKQQARGLAELFQVPVSLLI